MAERRPLVVNKTTGAREELNSPTDKIPVDAVPEMIGATVSTNGTSGLVPGALIAEKDKVLSGSKTWVSMYSHPDHSGDVTSTGDGATLIVNKQTLSANSGVNISNSPIVIAGDAPIITLTYGSIANTVCEGNDSRLSDARTPTTHDHDATNITSGVFDIARIPAAALERMTIVANESARFALTIATVQLGDTVKQTSPNGTLYIVIDTANLNTASGYQEYTAGSAASVPWSGITSKPTEFTPTAHSNHTATDITDFESAVTNNASVTANTIKVTNAEHTGDVTGSTTLTIANKVVSYAKMQDVSATDIILGRSSAGAGIVEEIPCKSFARSILNTDDAATARGTLGVEKNTFAVSDPVITSDANAGYSKNSLWVNTATQNAFICVDDTNSAAVWLQLGATTDITAEQFTGTGTQTDFTLVRTPVSKFAISISIQGIHQHTSSYSLSGNTLTLGAAPASGIPIEVVFLQ